MCCAFSLNQNVGDFSLLFVSFHFVYGTIFKILIKHVRCNEFFGECSVKDVKPWHNQINNSVVRSFHVYLIQKSYSCIITVLVGLFAFFLLLFWRGACFFVFVCFAIVVVGFSSLYSFFWSRLVYLVAKMIRVWKDQDHRVQPLTQHQLQNFGYTHIIYTPLHMSMFTPDKVCNIGAGPKPKK